MDNRRKFTKLQHKSHKKATARGKWPALWLFVGVVTGIRGLVRRR